MVSGIFWTFFRVIDLPELLLPSVIFPKARLLGESEAGETPVALRAGVRDEGVPESVTVKVPDTVPKAVGVNTTATVQLFPAARDEPHVVLLTANGLPVPVLIPVIETAPVVALVTVVFFAAEVLLTATLPNDRLVGDINTWL
jgi:hypothetical protein